MKKYVSVLGAIVAIVCLLTSSSERQFTIFMIGDSTMANKKDYLTSPERGWGMALQGFFTENVTVDNHALNGRSSKSFVTEGHWQKVYDAMKPGDYLVIQFGHNDEKGYIGDKRHTDAGLTFDDNLRMFVRAAQEKGATPILMNAVVRRCFWSNKAGGNLNGVDDETLRDRKWQEDKVNSDTLVDTHGAYAVAPRYVAKQLRVPFVDANKLTHDFEQSQGINGSRSLHMWLKPGEYGIEKGRQDNTHYNVKGAHEVASILVDAMADVCPELKPYVRHYDYIVSAKGHGNFMSLQDAVDAVPKGKQATILVIDGEWEKPKMKGKKVKIEKFFTAKILK